MSKPITKTLPTYEDFLLRSPLYFQHDIVGADAGNWMGDLITGEITIDAYCVECSRSTTFKGAKSRSMSSSYYINPVPDRWFGITLKCQRADHEYVYYVNVKDQKIQKNGQFPSMEDIAFSDIEKYRSVLGKQYFSELHRAGGLASYGIGIGAFVYLRRIFERLISEHYKELTNQGNQIPDFDKMRMSEKIDALKAVLPPAVVKHKTAYSILSKGIHELSETECNSVFPVLRAAIILMLEQDYIEAERKTQEKILETEINKAALDISKKPPTA